MLAALGVEWTNERAAYYTDEEYATALLAATPKGLAVVDKVALADSGEILPATNRRKRLAIIAIVVVSLLVMLRLVAWQWFAAR